MARKRNSSYVDIVGSDESDDNDVDELIPSSNSSAGDNVNDAKFLHDSGISSVKYVSYFDSYTLDSFHFS